MNEECNGEERGGEEKILPFHVPRPHVLGAIADFPAAHTHLGVKFDFTDFKFLLKNGNIVFLRNA